MGHACLRCGTGGLCTVPKLSGGGTGKLKPKEHIIITHKAMSSNDNILR